ncbi:glycosyltransferase [Varibaculum cambriense]|uniref:glycosyltransferase n=1 Tax=Varibaculum cambriense TaxID=184870 RepID=UPI00290E3064|nr:glycosyltransferase [Varibaculum cambriense]MDU5542252.1 hypothetical protein [Varibaculum cambriense]
MRSNPNILVISFSDIRRDARLLRQLSVVKDFGHVTTLGYGTQPEGSDEHLQVPSNLPSLPQTVPGVLKLALHLHGASEFAAPALRRARELLRDRQFDLVISNDARALPVAFYAAGDSTPVWADLHEWAPEERTHIASWRILVAPYIRYICKKYLPRTSAQTTVAGRIAHLYQETFGVQPQIMRNSCRLQDLEPSKTNSEQIRLVHSGGAVPGRALETTIKAVVAAGERFTLDLYLVPANDGGKYLRELKSLAEGSPRIVFHDPVKPAELPKTLNQYDVGVFWIPPFNTNARLTLPNKLFDFVQARLAIAVGPTVEMVDVVKKYNLGIVSKGFSVEEIVASLNTLDTESIEKYKQAVDHAATDLCFEKDAAVARKILTDLLHKNR